MKKTDDKSARGKNRNPGILESDGILRNPTEAWNLMESNGIQWNLMESDGI